MIGTVVGDGEVVCFSKEKKGFFDYFEGNITHKFDYFIGVLNETIRMINGKLSVTYEEKLDMLEKLKKIREKRGDIKS